MFGGNIADQLLNQYGFSHASSAEQADFSAFCVGGKQVDYLDSRLQNFHGRALVGKSGRRPVNGPFLRAVSRTLAVYGIAQNVEHTSQRAGAYRHLDGGSRVGDRHAAGQTLAGG